MIGQRAVNQSFRAEQLWCENTARELTEVQRIISDQSQSTGNTIHGFIRS